MTTVQTAWLVFALLLMAGEMVIPEMFLLWLGFAALAVFATLLGVPDLPQGTRVRIVAVDGMSLQVRGVD